MNFAYFLRVMLLAVIAVPAMSQEVARTFTYSADLTGDGRSEDVVLAIRSAAMDKPFRVTLTVTDSDKHVLFTSELDGAWFDEFFADEGYMTGCSNYDQCKRLYYFEDKPKSLSGCLKPGGTKNLARIIGFENSSEAARSFLEERKISPSVIDAALKELKTALQNDRTTSLCYDEHPQDHGQYFVWLKTVAGFVPYHVP